MIVVLCLWILFLGSPSVLSSIEYFGKQRKQEGAAGKTKNEEHRDVGGKTTQVRPQYFSFFLCPCVPGVIVLHEKPHEVIGLIGFLEQQCFILR